MKNMTEAVMVLRMVRRLMVYQTLKFRNVT